MDPLARRGFTKAVLIAGAGLWLPRVARAAPPSITLTGKLALEADKDTLFLGLVVRNTGRAAIEILANAARLEGTLRIGKEDIAFSLGSETVRVRSMSRSGHHLGHRLVLPPGEDVPYDRYGAPWPKQLTGKRSGVLAVRAVTVPLADRPEDEHPGLRALGALALSATIQRPR